MAGFTEGPWTAIIGVEEGDAHRCGVAAKRGDIDYLVATVENGAPGDVCDTELANAHLIAAAPDMHEALKRQAANMAFILNRVALPEGWFAKFNSELAEDRKAISKAEGKP